MIYLTLTPPNKLCDLELENDCSAMIYQLGFSYKLENYKQIGINMIVVINHKNR